MKAKIIAGLIVFSIFILPIHWLTLWTIRTMEFWLTRMNHTAIDFPYWLALLITFFFNGVDIIINIISEIIRLVIGG